MNKGLIGKISFISLLLLAFVVALIYTKFEFTMSVAFSFIFAIILIIFTSSFRKEFPSNFQTVKDLIRIVGSLDTRIWNREEVYERVKEIIVDQFDGNEEDVLPNSHFINDLGLE